jgi:tetratricopeptide (TPR) repeat protein
MVRLVKCGVIMLFLLASCASTYSAYKGYIHQGQNQLGEGNYTEARQSFLKAVEIEKDAESYALAATASYKMNDLPAADRYIKNAEQVKAKGFAGLRTAGYKALILLKEGRKAEGLDALKEYINYYRNTDPLLTIKQVQAMAAKGEVNLEKLEQYIDEQVNGYEEEVRQFLQTGTGFLDKAPNNPSTGP